MTPFSSSPPHLECWRSQRSKTKGTRRNGCLLRTGYQGGASTVVDRVLSVPLKTRHSLSRNSVAGWRPTIHIQHSDETCRPLIALNKNPLCASPDLAFVCSASRTESRDSRFCSSLEKDD